MADPRFFNNAGPFTLSELAALVGGTLSNATDGELSITDVAALSDASAEHISFLDNTKYVNSLADSKAGACILKERFKDKAPEGMALLFTEDPYRAYAMIAQKFYPAEKATGTISPNAHIDESAKLGAGCEVAAGASIGKNAVLGANCIIKANAVIGDGVSLGDNCVIHANASISHSEFGNNVIIHHGASIGQDGFGYAMGLPNHEKVPQLGKVIIEDNVEVGANTTIDRGAGPNTVIGAGTKIDNLVQIGHNAVLGKNCIIVSHVGISGSTKLGDFVVVGGQVGIAGHLEIGSGVQIAAQSGVVKDLKPGEKVCGSPAVPIRDFHRQTFTLQKLATKEEK